MREYSITQHRADLVRIYSTIMRRTRQLADPEERWQREQLCTHLAHLIMMLTPVLPSRPFRRWVERAEAHHRAADTLEPQTLVYQVITRINAAAARPRLIAPAANPDGTGPWDQLPAVPAAWFPPELRREHICLVRRCTTGYRHAMACGDYEQARISADVAASTACVISTFYTKHARIRWWARYKTWRARSECLDTVMDRLFASHRARNKTQR